jgi:hypothetical protein
MDLTGLTRVVERLVRDMPRNALVIELQDEMRKAMLPVASTQHTAVASTQSVETTAECGECAKRRASKKAAQKRWRAKGR